MKNQDKNEVFGENPFTQMFQKETEESFFQTLHEKVKHKSYYQKYKGFKNTLLVLSYLFNILSMATASYAVYWFFHHYVGAKLFAFFAAGIFLFFLESIKRRSSAEVLESYFFRKKKIAYGWGALSLLCFFCSLLSSSYGVKQGTNNMNPSKELIVADSLSKVYKNEIAALETKSTDLRGNKDKNGTTFYRLSKSIEAVEITLATYRSRLLEHEKKLEGNFEKLEKNYQAEINLTGNILILMTILFELLFEGSLLYIWYYYHRSYIERLSLKKTHKKLPKDGKMTYEYGQNGVNNSQAQRKDGFELPSMVNRTEIKGFLRKNEKTEKHNCTHVYTDKNTISHEYQKAGEWFTVYYTLPQIKGRINQYKKKLQEAEQNGGGEDVIKNRLQWLQYWKNKRRELLHKIEKAPMKKGQKEEKQLI